MWNIFRRSVNSRRGVCLSEEVFYNLIFRNDFCKCKVFLITSSSKKLFISVGKLVEVFPVTNGCSKSTINANKTTPLPVYPVSILLAAFELILANRVNPKPVQSLQ